jgi:hypothetical protein
VSFCFRNGSGWAEKWTRVSPWTMAMSLNPLKMLLMLTSIAIVAGAYTRPLFS